MTTNLPVPAGVVHVIADDLDGWMWNFFDATKAIASAVAEGRVPESTLTAIGAEPSFRRHDYLSELADAAGYADRDDEEAILIAVDAILGLCTGSAIIGDEWRRGVMYTWYFDDPAESLAARGITIDEFRAAVSALTIRQAAEVIVAAFAYLRSGRNS